MISLNTYKKIQNLSKELSELSQDLEAEQAIHDSYIRVSEEDSRRLSWILQHILKDWSREKIDHEMNNF